jgi:hypothetical protein
MHLCVGNEIHRDTYEYRYILRLSHVYCIMARVLSSYTQYTHSAYNNNNNNRSLLVFKKNIQDIHDMIRK